MAELNVLFSIYSLTALVIIIERLLPSPLLQPFNFIRLHEINQTVIFLSIVIALSFFYIRIFTNNFQSLKKRSHFLLVLCFIIGAYLYGAGEGWHEVASFTLNQYCSLNHLKTNLCWGLFINDYYSGNIIFFIGGLLMNISLLALSTSRPSKPHTKKNLLILVLNSVVYAFTWFAYSAFDTVLVGIFFSFILMLISLVFFIKVRKSILQYPFILYSTIAYSTATISAVIVRMLLAK